MDSKLFLGQEIGNIDDVILKLKKYFPHSSEGWDYISWVNTKLPKGIYLEIWYPYFNCKSTEMSVHLNMLEDKFEYSMSYMKKTMKKANYIGYGYVLGLLRIPYEKPVFYTKYYNYEYN